MADPYLCVFCKRDAGPSNSNKYPLDRLVIRCMSLASFAYRRIDLKSCVATTVNSAASNKATCACATLYRAKRDSERSNPLNDFSTWYSIKSAKSLSFKCGQSIPCSSAIRRFISDSSCSKSESLMVTSGWHLAAARKTDCRSFAVLPLSPSAYSDASSSSLQNARIRRGGQSLPLNSCRTVLCNVRRFFPTPFW